MFFLIKPTYIQVLIKNTMLEARIKHKYIFFKGSDLYFNAFYCSDIHKTKYSGCYEIWVKISKNAGGGWQLYPALP